MNPIANFIARTGTNPDFVAFMAHSGFAFGILSLLAHWHVTAWVTVPLFVLAAAAKEFWFDLRYETTPRQTFADSSLDFAGYMTGMVMALVLGMLG